MSMSSMADLRCARWDLAAVQDPADLDLYAGEGPPDEGALRPGLSAHGGAPVRRRGGRGPGPPGCAPAAPAPRPRPALPATAWPPANPAAPSPGSAPPSAPH